MTKSGNTRPLPSAADAIVRYDLLQLQEEVRLDFSPEMGSQRLLKQSEISARFRKKTKLKSSVG